MKKIKANEIDEEKYLKAQLLLKDLNDTIQDQKLNPSPVLDGVLQRQVQELQDIISNR